MKALCYILAGISLCSFVVVGYVLYPNMEHWEWEVRLLGVAFACVFVGFLLHEEATP